MRRFTISAGFGTLLSVRVLFSVLLASALGVPAEIVPAQSAPDQDDETAAEGLTQTLLGLNIQYQLAGPEQGPENLDTLTTVAQTRKQHMATLMEDTPQHVLRLAIPARQRATLPSAVQAQVEQEVTHDGELIILHEDNDQGGQYHHILNTGAEMLSLHFAPPDPAPQGKKGKSKSKAPKLLTGSMIRVKGVQVGQALALPAPATSVQVLPGALPHNAYFGVVAAALPNTFGVQKTVVILVNFQDDPTNQPYTVSYAHDNVFTSVNAFDLEASYGQASLAWDVFGWYTIPMNSTVCDFWTLATYAKQAATAAGHNLSGYTRFVYGFPRNACNWSGLGMVGGSPSASWIRGTMSEYVVAHEMGHNLGLWHSHTLNCTGGGIIGGTGCTKIEYGDITDTMGSGGTSSGGGHYNAFQKERLGWLNAGASPPIRSVSASGTYIIDQYETPGTNPKALKIQNGSNSAKYYVEFRRPIGFDSFLGSNSNVMNGVVIHRGDPSDGDSSYLLDMTNATPTSWYDPALDVGLSFTDPYTGVTISTVSLSSTAATVNVSTTPTPCVHTNPVVAISPSQSQWVQAGTMVKYTVSVTNQDSATACTASTFNVQDTVPAAGWAAAVTPAPPLTLNPGASTSTTLQVTSPTSTADGFYTIGVTTTNTACTTCVASTSGTYVVNTGSSGGTFTDSFNRVPSTDLGIGWTEVIGDLVISNSQLATAKGGANIAVIPALGGATQSSEADFNSLDNNSGGRFGVILRYKDPKNYYMAYRWVGGSSVLRISKVVNGTETVLAQRSLPNPPKNTPFHIKGRAEGSTLTLELGGVAMVTVPADSTFTTGSAGIMLGMKNFSTYFATTVLADNFSATAN